MTNPTASAPRFRVHLESRRAQSAHFHLTPEVWAEAGAAQPALAARLDPSFGWDGERLPEALSDADFLIAGKFDMGIVGAAPRLSWIHTPSAGVDALMPLDDLRADLVLTNSSGVHATKAGDYAAMALLMLNARMPELIDAQRDGRWIEALTAPIHGKTVVVIGFGDIGQAVGWAALSLGLEVVAVTRSGVAAPRAPAVRVVATSGLDALLPDADFVVVTAPLTAQTRGLLNRERLFALRPTAGLVNLARAALVDYDALATRLRDGALCGAVLDVFATEPLPADSPWWRVPRLVVTPHVSCDPPDYGRRVLDLWFANFARRVAGEALHNRVDRERGY